MYNRGPRALAAGPLLDARDEQGPRHGAEMREGMARREETDAFTDGACSCAVLDL